nr:MAG TPA: hypothetical protein [Caudoviricetes sp.]
MMYDGQKLGYFLKDDLELLRIHVLLMYEM